MVLSVLTNTYIGASIILSLQYWMTVWQVMVIEVSNLAKRYAANIDIQLHLVYNIPPGRMYNLSPSYFFLNNCSWCS